MPTLALSLGYGTTLIVAFFSCILVGIVFVQAQHYYVTYTRDRWLKLFVAGMLILDLLSAAVTIAWQYSALIAHWGNEQALLSNSWLLSINPLFCGLMGSLVHSFFAYRVYAFTQSRVWPCLIGASALPALGGAIGTCVAFALNLRFGLLRGLATVWLGCSVAADVTITLVMSHQFRKRRGNFRHTDNILDRLVLLSVQNGLLTTLTALADLILFLAYGSPTHTVSSLIPKLYTISVLSSLNFRREQRDSSGLKRSDPEIGAFHVPSQSDQSTKDYRGRPAHDTPSQRVVIDLQSRVTDGIDPAWKSGPTVE